MWFAVTQQHCDLVLTRWAHDQEYTPHEMEAWIWSNKDVTFDPQLAYQEYQGPVQKEQVWGFIPAFH